MKETLINYLQGMMDDFQERKDVYGIKHPIMVAKFDAIIACKEMVEAVIGEPVNLQQDGKVTVGF